MTTTQRPHVDMRMEYQHGYAISHHLTQVLRGYRDRALMRNELRVFAAKLEHGALPANSKVDLAHIINKKAQTKGVRRLTGRDIATAEERLERYLKGHGGERLRPKSVPRRALRLIAQGRCTKAEAALLFMYSLRRITQTKVLERLEPGERYARFKLEDLRELSGVPKASSSRALTKLRAKGFIGNIEVSKRNEFASGLLYVDGPVISLVRRRQPVARPKVSAKETTTAPRRIDNSPPCETTTISKKSYLKRSKKESYTTSGRRATGRSLDREFERIVLRASQMKAEWMDQAA